MDCALAGAKRHLGRPLNKIVSFQVNQPRECQKCGTLFSAAPGVQPGATVVERCSVCGAGLGEPGTFVPSKHISEVRPWMLLGASVEIWAVIAVILTILGVTLK